MRDDNRIIKRLDKLISQGDKADSEREKSRKLTGGDAFFDGTKYNYTIAYFWNSKRLV